MPILLNRTLRLFLDSIGRREEYEYYLRRFHSQRGAAFAILCPEPAGFDEVAPFFSFDLDFLMRLELFPVLLLCGKAAELRGLLGQGSVAPAFLPIEPLLDGEAGPGTPARILDFLGQCRRQERPAAFVVPGRTWGDVLPRLIPGVAERVHFIRVRGPLRAGDGTPLAFYYQRRPPEGGLAAEDRDLADGAARLLEARPGTHLSVASPWKLLEELFTVKGAGCVIRTGAQIRRFERPGEADENRLAALFEESFGRRLARRDFLERADTLYLGGDYEGAALIERHEAGAYLSKFAVSTEARGEGLANELWAFLAADEPCLFWRARTANPINHWYEKQADGYHREKGWKVFWKGVASDHLPALIRHALEREDDFAASPET